MDHNGETDLIKKLVKLEFSSIKKEIKKLKKEIEELKQRQNTGRNYGKPL